MIIREINPKSEFEIDLVAHRMQQTLIEVLGYEKGEAMYSIDWLRDRVKWHLDQSTNDGQVFLIENQDQEIVGHAIVRVDFGSSFGYFSTIFIEPASRKNGLAKKLIKHVETWFKERKTPRIIYNTGTHHIAIIKLFESHGYKISLEQSEMVQLSKNL
ncbi:MAG: GNAT family N-acetyltransferase [Bdellovibrionales bacterium]|nr:GNAT family N-acetyltransferase [Bdellovibrionales bacterium]